MDRTAWFVIILCGLGILYLTLVPPKRMPAPPPPDTGEVTPPPSTGDEPGIPPEGIKVPEPEPDPDLQPATPAENITVDNGVVEFLFSNLGGGIAQANLREHSAHPSGKLLINDYSRHPIGTITRGNDVPMQALSYDVTQPDDYTVVFRGQNPSGIDITKTFRVNPPGGDPHEAENDPHIVELEVQFKNSGDAVQQLTENYVYTGALTHMHPKEPPLYLLYNWSDGGKADEIDVNWFRGARFVVQWRAPQTVLTKEFNSLQWAGACNQFYASLVIPEKAGTGKIWSRRFPVTLKGYSGNPNEKRPFYAIHGGISIPDVMLNPGDSTTVRYRIYTGPREYPRLKRLGNDLDGVMHYGNMPMFGGMMGVIPFVSRNLISLMIWLEHRVHNWGVAILIITFLLRLLIWPLHAKSTRTMKRMSLLAPKMTELKEEHANDPKRMQEETMKLYRDYGVNPLGGCLPVFLQLPVFLGFYQMLRSAVELRDKGFLWVPDLSMPDTVFTIKNFPVFGELPINLLPLLMAATMLLQMQLAPKTGDKMQRRIFLFMPLIFLVICYNFASALALYWTGQNIFSIGQTWLMNRRPDPVLEKKKARAKLDPKKMMSGSEAKKPKKRRRRTGG